jgi:opacity protein-like surface antigen
MLSRILLHIFWQEDRFLRRTWAAVVATFVISVPTTSWAQPQSPPTPRFTREVSVSVGLGHVFVYEGATLGDRLNIGGSLAIVHRSGVGVEFEVNRTLGFSPGLAQCAIEGTFCFVTTHAGIRPPTIASVNFQYRYKARRVQPYVTAGIAVVEISAEYRTDRWTGGDPHRSRGERHRGRTRFGRGSSAVPSLGDIHQSGNSVAGWEPSITDESGSNASGRSHSLFLVTLEAAHAMKGAPDLLVRLRC